MASVPAAVSPAAGPEPGLAIAQGPRGPRWRHSLPALLFMGPAAVLLGFLVVYPTVATVLRSFYDRSGDSFIGFDNYRTLFGTATILVAIRNNAIWVIVFPFLVSFIGLVFAVLTERVRWATAFKTIVFAPMVISLFASGVIWRIVYETDPHRGVINSAIGTVADTIHPPGLYTGANVKAASGLQAGSGRELVSTAAVSPGETAKLGLTGILPDDVPPAAKQARAPSSSAGAISGVVWRDFSPGHQRGGIYPGEPGLPGMRVSLRSADGQSAGHATTDDSGVFQITGVPQGSYHVVIDENNFETGFKGINWLGTQSLTPTSGLGETGRSLLNIPLVDIAAILAMLWIWSGFSMVVIGAGLASLNREVLEAARMDGASEWQTFRHVTLPLLRPVLIVVFVTMIINVLKIFDILLALPPDSSQQEANVIALEMWRVGFTGTGDFGLASAVAVFLFLLVIPAMLINVRRIRA